MTYITNNFDEEYFTVKKWTVLDEDEGYSELQDQIRELKRLNVKPKVVKPDFVVAIAKDELTRKRKHYAFVAIASFLSSLFFFSALLLGGGLTSQFPLSFIVAFFISLAAAMAFYVEYKDSLGGRNSN